MPLIWDVPDNAVGRYLICAFVAVVFAGEYGWNTWKLIVPHRAADVADRRQICRWRSSSSRSASR